MTDTEQLEAFDNDMAKLIYRYKEEFGLYYPGMIGVIEMHKLSLYNEFLECTKPETNKGE